MAAWAAIIPQLLNMVGGMNQQNQQGQQQKKPSLIPFSSNISQQDTSSMYFPFRQNVNDISFQNQLYSQIIDLMANEPKKDTSTQQNNMDLGAIISLISNFSNKGSTTGGLMSNFNNYQNSNLGNMNWRNTSNYNLGGF